MRQTFQTMYILVFKVPKSLTLVSFRIQLNKNFSFRKVINRSFQFTINSDNELKYFTVNL